MLLEAYQTSMIKTSAAVTLECVGEKVEVHSNQIWHSFSVSASSELIFPADFGLGSGLVKFERPV